MPHEHTAFSFSWMEQQYSRPGVSSGECTLFPSQVVLSAPSDSFPTSTWSDAQQQICRELFSPASGLPLRVLTGVASLFPGLRAPPGSPPALSLGTLKLRGLVCFPCLGDAGPVLPGISV